MNLFRAKTVGWVSLICLALTIVAGPMSLAGEHAHGAGSGAPGMQSRPQLAISAAVAPDGRLWVTGMSAEGKLYVRSAEAADSLVLGPMRTLNTGSDRIAAEGENRPKIAFGPRSWAIITYTQPLSKPYTGEIRMLRSGDGGRNFSMPYTVHQDRQVITHRFESVMFDENGTLHTLWIDKRDAEGMRQGSARDRSSRAQGEYRGAAVYRNESRDGGRTFGPDIKVADHSCECCRIALAPSESGGLVALWRHVFEPNQRDHAFVRLAPHAPPGSVVRATYDRWALDACPHHGPAMAPARAGGFHIVWFGDRAGTLRARYGRLGSDGAPLGEPIELPDPRAEHADIRSAGNTTVVSWRSFDGTATQWKVWVSRDDGKSFESRTIAGTRADNDYPVLLVYGRSIIGLWNTVKGLRIETLAN